LKPETTNWWTKYNGSSFSLSYNSDSQGSSPHVFVDSFSGPEKQKGVSPI